VQLFAVIISPPALQRPPRSCTWVTASTSQGVTTRMRTATRCSTCCVSLRSSTRLRCVCG